MVRSIPCVAAALSGLAAISLAPSGARTQGVTDTGGACITGTPVVSYRCETLPNTLTLATAITPTGATVIHTAPTDDATATVVFPAGFVFPFYGSAKTSMNVCTNGFIDFGATGSAVWNNSHPGDEAVPNECIMPWHDDLILTSVPAPAGVVSYKFSSESPPHKVTVEWYNVSTYRSGGVGHGKILFQAVLYSTASPTPGRIEFKYDHHDNFDGDLLVLGAPFGSCTGFTSTYAISATVGLDSAGTTAIVNTGVEALDRGAANFYFPYTDVALVPLSFRGTEMNYPAAALTLVPQEPFCSIVGRVGTMMIAGMECPGSSCMDDTPSPQRDGTLVHFPFFWKFNLHGRLFQSVSVSPNGFLAFGTGQWTTVGATNALLPGVAEPEAMIAPFWDDLEEQCAAYGASSGMFYRVDGALGCRVLTFEWSHFGRSTAPKADGVADGNISFQIRFFEGSAGSVAGCPAGGLPLTVVPGVGNDRIEFLYDHPGYIAPVSGPFSATIGYENHKGAIGASLAGSPAFAAPPLLGSVPAKVVIEQCDEGVVRTYGRQTPYDCPRELLWNAVPPRTGNTFGLRMAGVTPRAIALFLFDFGGPLPGMNTPVACGGIPFPGGLLWVRLPPFSEIVVAGITSTSSGSTPAGLPDCEGGITFPLTIPAAATLVGAVAFVQGVTISAALTLLDSTQGMKITIGS